ncbi:hypothetical protein R6Q59_013610 [Mikania micrantha]
MDIKSAFLYGTIKEEVYVCQPRICDGHHPDWVYKLDKALYGLKQAPRACSDYAGCSLTRKSTSGGCQFFAGCLVSWQSKKQTSVSNSTAEAEYIAAAHCTAQILWLQYQLLDFGKRTKNTSLIDNEAAKNIIKNPVYHSKTKHIEIRHHFIRDCFEKGLIVPEHVSTSDQIAEYFIKPLDSSTFSKHVVWHEALMLTCRKLHAYVNGVTASDQGHSSQNFVCTFRMCMNMSS